MRADGGPTGGDGVAAGALEDSVGMIKSLIESQKCFPIGVKAVDGTIDVEDGIVIAPFPVFCFMIDGRSDHFYFADGKIALKIRLVVPSIPKAEFHKRKQFQ